LVLLDPVWNKEMRDIGMKKKCRNERKSKVGNYRIPKHRNARFGLFGLQQII